MTDFTFATAATIRFGAGVASELPALSEGIGQRAFVVTGGNPDRVSAVLGGVEVAGSFALDGEPSFDDARAAIAAARECAPTTSSASAGERCSTSPRPSPRSPSRVATRWSTPR